MTWSVLLHLLHPTDPSATQTAIIVYGCMFAQAGTSDKTLTVSTVAPADEGFAVHEWRFEIDDMVASAIKTDLEAGKLSLATFGIPNLPSSTAAVATALIAQQPAAEIARQQRTRGSCWGVPPGFVSHPTWVASYPMTPSWQPADTQQDALVSTPTSELPERDGRATLNAMQRLSGLPFHQSYAERISRFEIMKRPPGTSGLTIRGHVLPTSRGGRTGLLLSVETPSAIDLHVLAKCKGETVFDALYRNQSTGKFSVPLPRSPNTVEWRAFQPTTGQLVAHDLLRGHMSIAVNARMVSGSARINDALSKSAPPSRQDAASKATRFTSEIWNIDHVEAVPDDLSAKMRALVNLRENKPALAEWFPRGISGELDVVARLVHWAEEPTVDELIIVDPFLSPETFTRLVRRIGREDLKVTAIASLSGENPDEFGKPADATGLLRAALDSHEQQFACTLRVLNIVEGRYLSDGAQKTDGQAFHDRYVILRFKDGHHRVFVLTNSLNKAAGNWPFVLSELSPAVSDQVKAYVDGLLTLKDLASRLNLIATLDWTNAHHNRRVPRQTDFGPKLTKELLQTLSWLLGDPDWRHHQSRFSRRSARRILLVAQRRGLIAGRSPRVTFGATAVTIALRRQSRRLAPVTAKELANLLLGLGVICRWSAVEAEHVGKAFSPQSISRVLGGALKRAFDSIPLSVTGTEDYDVGSLWSLSEGRELVWRVNAAIEAPNRKSSPDNRLTGALNIALVANAEKTLGFIESNPHYAVKEFGLHEILLALSEFSTLETFPAPTNAKSLVLRTAAILAMSKTRSSQQQAYDASSIKLAIGHWDLASQLWGLVVAYDRASLDLRTARRRSGTPVITQAAKNRQDLASMIASLWPASPPTEMLDWICEVLDWCGEDIVYLAETIESAGHTVDGLWRKLIRHVETSLALPKTAITGYALDLALDAEGDQDIAFSEMLMAAFAYVIDTRQHSLTRNATKFTPVMDHCWRQVQDPLFYAFRRDNWWRRCRVLLRIYIFVYRILDEAARMGVVKGDSRFVTAARAINGVG
jgi:hypothetical protein